MNKETIVINKNAKDMTREEKDLVFQDLCARLPYGVKVEVKNYRCNGEVRNVEIETLNVEHLTCPIERYRPYLRPMSSMTEEEKRELQSFFPGSFGNQWLDVEAGYIDIYECESTTRLYLYDANRLIDWLNKKMFDFRGLIPRGHALSTEAFNPY